MTRWGMVIDLRNCIGCKACSVVCKQTNQVPPESWRRIVDGGVSAATDRQRTFVPMSCMHCGEPPCLDVCPTNATYQRHDGIVASNYELCIGCGYCVVACPYLSRTIIFRNEFVLDPEVSLELTTAATNPDRVGVATKCNFCTPRVDAGLAQGLQPGLDAEATPACVLSCSAQALHFGDLDDPDSVVSQLIRENKTVRLQEEVGTDPAVYYIVE